MGAERYRCWRRWLPYGAAVLLVALLASGWVTVSELNRWKGYDAPDTGAEAVERALGEVQGAARNGNLDTGSEAFQRLERSVPGGGMLLLVDAQGQVLYRRMPRKAGRLDSLTTAHLRRVLAALPPDALTAGQRLLLQTSDAVLAEGEHADVYSYAARLLVDRQGNPVGAVAVAYDRSARAPSSLYTAALLVSVTSLGLYWLSLPLWVVLDARARGERRAWLWGLLALAGNLVGVLTYLLMRRPAAAACPGCARTVEEGWEYCAHCGRDMTMGGRASRRGARHVEAGG